MKNSAKKSNSKAVKTQPGSIAKNVGYPAGMQGVTHSAEKLKAIEAKIGKNAPFSKLKKELAKLDK